MFPYYLAYGLFEYGKLKYLGNTEPIGCSLSPGIECNLNCLHCYEKSNRTSGKEVMSLEEMDRLAGSLSKKGMKHCTLTDGEPLLSKDSIAKCEAIIKHFWMNYIVTNGTVEIIDFPVTYILSLDGPRGIHDKIRGEGVFERMKANVKKSPVDNIYGLCTVNSINKNSISETVMAAKELGIRGIMFNWHTPSSHDDPLWVDFPERNRNIDQILKLKAEDEFIYNTHYELDVLRTPDWTRNCLAHLVPSYDAFGTLKEPCIFNGGICEKCGCHVYPALQESVLHGSRTVQYRMALDHIEEFWAKDKDLIDGLFSLFNPKDAGPSPT